MRIGNGTGTRIWKDKWKVSVIDQGDVQVWRATKNGIFSVKSAYYIQKDLEAKGVAECSSRHKKNTIWRDIWDLKLPNVEKNFLWRACHDILPTRVNLHRQKIIDDPLCPICEIEEETVLHVLLQCPAAVDVWCVGDKKLQKSTMTGKEFIQIVESIFAKCNMEEIQLFFEIAWKIWMRRNDVVHGNFFVHPTELVQCARSNLDEFLQVTEGSTTQNLVSADARLRSWSAPLTGWLKANWDASFEKHHGWMGFGVVVRDERGFVVAAQVKTFLDSFDPSVAEARAALMAIQLCKEMGFMHVLFEGDAKVVIDGVNSSASDWSRIGLLVKDIRREIQAIQQWRMSFIHVQGGKLSSTCVI